MLKSYGLSELTIEIHNDDNNDLRCVLDHCILTKIQKMCEHIRLEIVRMGLFNKTKDSERVVQEQYSAFVNSLGLEHDNVDLLKTDLEKTSQQVGGNMVQVVTVLSIFSAIIISFFCGLNFISSAIVSIQQVSIFKSAVIVLILGIVLLNIIFVMMYFIAKIIKKYLCKL